jgi:hypothetical protein
MARLDAEAVGGVVSRIDAERAAGMRRLVGRLADQGVLRDGLGRKRAEDILFMLSSFESFDALYTDRGMSVARVAELLIEIAERALYERP